MAPPLPYHHRWSLFTFCGGGDLRPKAWGAPTSFGHLSFERADTSPPDGEVTTVALAGRGIDARDELVNAVGMLGIDRDRRLPVALALRVDVQAGRALVVEGGGGRWGVHHNHAGGEQGRKDGQSEGSNAHWWAS